LWTLPNSMPEIVEDDLNKIADRLIAR
jgi:hypothetical protein